MIGNNPMKREVDYLVIGSGLAGLTFALNASAAGRVALLTKRSRSDASSSWAQGGIAGALGDDDSFALHLQDTLVAGAGLCNTDAVETLVQEGPERIRELMEMGAGFNTEIDEAGNTVLQLGREGGHSRNRIVHTADYTGWECERTLLEAVRNTPEIEVYEHFFVTDLAVGGPQGSPECLGAWVVNAETGEQSLFRAKATLLATGGSGQVYQHTTNPQVATGDGAAMAWRAGALLANMEFVQFHPTTLYHPDARAFLITEALRGEGGILQHDSGEQFMEKYHPLKELAPRDVVARAIVQEMKRTSAECLYLNVSHLPSDLLHSHFPTVTERCLSVGIDITRQPIPIVPAQHYQCGGVVTDLHGVTSIPRLYAAGEVACTGVHGANRLASNSLLEAMVFGRRAALHALQHAPTYSSEQPVPLQKTSPETDSAQLASLWKQVRSLMQRNAGIVRTSAEMQNALGKIESIRESICPTVAHMEAVEAVNAIQVASLVLQSALMRKESRGLHYTLDYPKSVESERHDTLIYRSAF